MRNQVVKMEEPIVSIIIATFNSESCIREALESVYNITLRNWECVIVDGASSDNTVQIIKEYELKDNRFRHISEKDNGIYDAFNKGWKLAKGEWVYYLGSDDKLMPDALYSLISSSEDASIVYGDMSYDTGLGIKTKHSIPEYSLVGNMPCHQSMIMKRELLECLGGFDLNRYKICADFDLFQRSLKSGITVKYVNNVVVACFNSLGTSSGILHYLKECYTIKRKYRGGLFAYWYVLREGIKRCLKTVVYKFAN